MPSRSSLTHLYDWDPWSQGLAERRNRCWTWTRSKVSSTSLVTRHMLIGATLDVGQGWKILFAPPFTGFVTNCLCFLTGIYLRRIPGYPNMEQLQSHRLSELIGTYRPQSHHPASCSNTRAEPLRLRHVAELTGLGHRPSELWSHTSLTKFCFHEMLQAFLEHFQVISSFGTVASRGG